MLDSFHYLQTENRLQIYGFVILENHLHCIAASENLSKEIGDFKSFTARKILDHLQEKNSRSLLEQLELYKLNHKSDRQYQLWQESSHPQCIQNIEMMRQKLEYIHYNPVKRGYVDDPLHWRYSSTRNYAGLEGLLEVFTEWYEKSGRTQSVGTRENGSQNNYFILNKPVFYPLISKKVLS